MKRDFDLIRRILTDIENLPAGEYYHDISYLTEYTPSTIYAHIDLLINAGLMQGKVIKTMGGIASVNISGLTWEGHDFIDAARDNSIWNKAKETVLKPTASITFDILVEWLKFQAKQTLGLP